MKAIAILFEFSLLILYTSSQTCSTQTGVVWGSDNIAQLTASSVSACCTACQQNSKCVTFTFDTVNTTNNCYLKDNFDSVSDNSNRTSGIRDGVTWTLTVSGSSALNTISNQFLSYTMDWWPPSDTCEDGGHCWGNASILNANLNLPKLITSASQLAPTYLRIGGTLEDSIIYEVNGTTCTNQAQCLNMTRWDQVIKFAQTCNISLVFGLNYMGQRSDSGWNSKNAHDLLQYTFTKYGSSVPLYGVELGNELDLDNKEYNFTRYGAAYSELRSIVNTIWGSSTPKPKIMGPASSGTGSSYMTPAVQASKVDIVTYHSYRAGSGTDPAVETKMLDPSFLNGAISMATGIYNTIQAVQPGTPIWLGEGALCYGSGRANVSNRYEDTLWYLDQLSILAQNHHVAWARQALIGGYYELVDHETLNPNPDWWGALLWRRLMGTTVLKTSSSIGTIRIYAHCTRNPTKAGSVTILIINVDRNINHASIHVTLDGVSSLTPRDEYRLTTPTGNGESDDISLNGGKPLQLGADGSVPSLTPVTVTDANTPLLIAPFSVNYIVLPSAGASVCSNSFFQEE